jgi:predicted HTH domain antitoxin
MTAVSVRELKNNPSAALRDARRAPVVVLKRNHPEAVLVHLSDDSLLGEPGVRLAIATALYRSESLSLGRAAEISGISIAEFMQHVSQLGIPVIRGDSDSLARDMGTISESLQESSPSTPAR